MKYLYSIDWSGRYKDASFVPFRTSASLTDHDQKQAMEYHNNYLHSTYRKLVKVANPTHEYECDDGEMISFRSWLIQSQLHGIKMVEGVETMKDGLVRIIYNKDNQEGVDFIMKTLRENAIAAFGEENAINMLGDDFDIVTHFNSELEDEHAHKIKSSWQGKQTKNISQPNQQHKIFYGSNKSENLYQGGDVKSYSEVTRSTLSMSETQIVDSQRENEDLRNMIIDLKQRLDSVEQKHQTFAKTIKNTLKQELMREFDGVISDFRKEMNATVSAIKTEFTTTIEQYEKLGREREERLNSQSLTNFRIVAAELLNQQPSTSPSEPSNMTEQLHGGAQ